MTDVFLCLCNIHYILRSKVFIYNSLLHYYLSWNHRRHGMLKVEAPFFRFLFQPFLLRISQSGEQALNFRAWLGFIFF